MTEEQAAPPKRVAMQVALAAEQKAEANAVAISELAKRIDNSPPLAIGRDEELTKRVDELAQELGNITALAEAAAEAGGSAPVGGVLAELRDTVSVLADRVGLIEDHRNSERELWKQTRGRLDTLEEWRTAELDEDRLGSGDALADLNERLFKIEAQLNGGAALAGLTSTARPSAPHVLGLIAQLQRRVHEISKGREFKAENQRGETTQRYSFRGIDEAQNAIGSAQREIGLIGPKVTIVEKSVSVTEVNKGSYTQVWTTVSVTARYTFQSPIDGSEWSTEGCGMGRDLGDKAESKALAGAFKYALFHGLNIPVKGVFVDAETEDPRIEQDNADRREQRGYAQERIDRDAGRTYGHGHAPIDGEDPFGGADPAEQRGDDMAHAAMNEPPATPPQDDRSPAEQATAALNAARQAVDVHHIAAIWQRAHDFGILSMHVEGIQLGQHLIAALNILPGGRAVQLPGMEHYR